MRARVRGSLSAPLQSETKSTCMLYREEDTCTRILALASPELCVWGVGVCVCQCVGGRVSGWMCVCVCGVCVYCEYCVCCACVCVRVLCVV